MENLKLSERKNRNRTLLIGAGLVALLIAPIGGSASLEGGGFFIYAYNDQEPEINARAGLNGLASNPGGENPGSNLASTVTCGDQSITVTQAMLDFSDKNREIVSQGGEAKQWKDGGWKFIFEGSYYEAITGTSAPFELDLDKAFIFSNSPAITANDYVVPTLYDFHFTDGRGGPALQKMTSSYMSDATGKKASMIGALSIDVGGQILNYCSYVKFENGAVGASGSPALYTQEKSSANGMESITNTTGYIEGGMPAFGPDRASILVESLSESSSSKIDIYFLESNGEAWDYENIAESLWHPSKLISGSAVTEWTECFGEDCSLKIDYPTVARSDSGTGVINYSAPRVLNGATNISIADDGQEVRTEYIDRFIRDAGADKTRFSRNDGPAIYKKDKAGNLIHSEYYIDGYTMTNRSEYETAGGTGWVG